ncbi:hypothetical protein G6F65_023514 [Rhizopus arrhizus]|nr:hypothetical protein G6F65_023514 [Rhizopus arrhizus]
MPAPPSRSRHSRAMSIAMRQLFHLARLTCCGCSWPASFNRPNCNASSCAVVMRRAISASLICALCVAANGRPDRPRSWA